MKLIVLALLVLAAYSSNWNVISSFPSCYTSVPFTVTLVTTEETYGFEPEGLP